MEDAVFQHCGSAAHWAAFFQPACALKEHSTGRHHVETTGVGFQSLRLGRQHRIARLAEHAAQAEREGGNLSGVFLHDALL